MLHNQLDCRLIGKGEVRANIWKEVNFCIKKEENSLSKKTISSTFLLDHVNL